MGFPESTGVQSGVNVNLSLWGFQVGHQQKSWLSSVERKAVLERYTVVVMVASLLALRSVVYVLICPMTAQAVQALNRPQPCYCFGWPLHQW